MSLTCNGIKKLDANFYERIIIIEDPQTHNYRISVKGEDNKLNGIYPTNPSAFSKRIRGLSDEEKITEIVSYYLDYHKIKSIGDKYIDYYDKCSCVESDFGDLILKVHKPLDIYRKCILKYGKDRKDFLSENSDIINYEISISQKESLYQIREFETSKQIELRLQYKDDSLWKYDEEFIKEFIYEKLNSIGVPALIVGESYYWPAFENYLQATVLTCGNLQVHISDSRVKSVLSEVVNKYNESLEKRKRLQLKMEGF